MDKHGSDSTFERSASTSQQYYEASNKAGRMAKDVMRESLERRYPPSYASRNARAEPTYAPLKHPSGAGSRNTVRSFTQPFTLSSQTSHQQRTSQYRAPTPRSPAVSYQEPRRLCSVGSSTHFAEYDSASQSSTASRKPRGRIYVPAEPEPKYLWNYYSPPSTIEPFQYDGGVHVDHCRDMRTKGKASTPARQSEKPLPHIKPEATYDRAPRAEYCDSKAPDRKAKEPSSDRSDLQYHRRCQRQEDVPASHNNVVPRPTVSTSPPVTPNVIARQERRYIPGSGVGEDHKERLNVDEVEEEITCPVPNEEQRTKRNLSMDPQETCPICRKELATPVSLSLVPLHVMDAIVEKWVKAKGIEWDGITEWKERCEVWEAQRVVWREDLAAIEKERKHQADEREGDQQLQGNQEHSFGPIDRPQPALGDFLLTDLLSLGMHDGGVPRMESSAQLREYIRPDPISSFLDEVSRLRREIRTERDRYLSTTLQASFHSPSLTSRSPQADPRPFAPTFSNNPEWEVYSPMA
ncbi:hypothetical protein QFC22_000909 [Naganishia vaughanmartiniae]|uniref:Uncharacterized protein n=1 Tax=Naganishia vaughanmartiniae TaxID=1424756 RepID=A0ACC2XKZ8_9TREE|nr:hypothetical protein QFC22_000909 [Naganishia vaughanmartiniae]